MESRKKNWKKAESRRINKKNMYMYIYTNKITKKTFFRGSYKNQQREKKCFCIIEPLKMYICKWTKLWLANLFWLLSRKILVLL